MKYPIGIQTFEKIIQEGYVYVDKTDLIYEVAREHVCFLSRPRRFGKSLLISTLEAYFMGKKELFSGLKMEALESDWVEYPIFRLDFATGDFNNKGELLRMLDGKIAEWESIYGRNEFTDTIGERFKYVLEQAYIKTGKKAVVLIDEYDKPLLDTMGEEEEKINRDILRGFYGVFKAADASLRHVLLTGVTKFSQITVFSGFNQANDISFDSKFDAICGITEDELHSVFAEPIKEMSVEFGCTEDEMKKILKKQYDGYHFSKELLDIYNPFSIINAFNKMDIDDYWYRSGTPTYLAKLIEGHKVNMQRLLAREYETRFFVDYRTDVENTLAIFYQSGYLTIKAYNKKDRVYTLDFPNDEVRKGFLSGIVRKETVEMNLTSTKVRKRVLKMANECKRNTHLGGALSIVELLTVLYKDVMNYDFTNPEWEGRDRFILSKGHCALTLDAIMVEAGVISEEDSKTYLQDGSAYSAHPVMNIAHGIESSSGSLGQGISMAVGLAKAAKIQEKSHKIYTLIGNGECDEGSVWEAVMLAAQWKLDNLTIIVDDNKLQGDGYATDIVDMSNLDERFKAFGFMVVKVDGHDEKAIKEAFDADSDGKPKVIIADTIKGKGVSFIEDNNAWHHNRLTDEMYSKAMGELGGLA